MIPKRVTVDLILTVFERVSSLVESEEFTTRELCYYSVNLLSQWERTIEAQGLSVSLEAIVENAFRRLGRSKNPSATLLEIGMQLIEKSAHIETLLFGERFSQPGRLENLAELEQALKDKQLLDWFSGAKRIIGVVNSTNASDALRAALKWFLDFSGPVSPFENPVLRRFLDEAIGGQKPDIPGAFADLFEERYLPIIKTHKEVAQRLAQGKRNRTGA
jgi:hypothetical protein